MPPSVIRNFSGNYAFLSNFYKESNGKSVEHYFQAAKCTNPLDAAIILRAPNPGIAKRLGRTVDLVEGWEESKDIVMLTCLRYKFSAPILAKLLKVTGESLLVEENTWGDRYWGQVHGQGKNMLGKLLMQIRSELMILGSSEPQ